MKIDKKVFIIAIISLLIFLCVSVIGILIFGSSKEHKNEPVSPTFTGCIEGFGVGSNDINDLKALSEKAGGYFGPGYSIDHGLETELKAESPNQDLEPVEIEFNKTDSGEESFLYYSKEKDDFYLNSNYFGSIKRSGLIIEPLSEFEVGEYKETDFNEFTPREVTRFLLKSNILSSYDHTHANLCLEEESDSDEEYRASYKATHYYYTNESNEETYKFEIALDKESGKIKLSYPVSTDALD